MEQLAAEESEQAKFKLVLEMEEPRGRRSAKAKRPEVQSTWDVHASGSKPQTRSSNPYQLGRDTLKAPTPIRNLESRLVKAQEQAAESQLKTFPPGSFYNTGSKDAKAGRSHAISPTRSARAVRYSRQALQSGPGDNQMDWSRSKSARRFDVFDASSSPQSSVPSEAGPSNPSTSAGRVTRSKDASLETEGFAPVYNVEDSDDAAPGLSATNGRKTVTSSGNRPVGGLSGLRGTSSTMGSSPQKKSASPTKHQSSSSPDRWGRLNFRIRPGGRDEEEEQEPIENPDDGRWGEDKRKEMKDERIDAVEQHSIRRGVEARGEGKEAETQKGIRSPETQPTVKSVQHTPKAANNCVVKSSRLGPKAVADVNVVDAWLIHDYGAFTMNVIAMSTKLDDLILRGGHHENFSLPIEELKNLQACTSQEHPFIVADAWLSTSGRNRHVLTRLINCREIDKLSKSSQLYFRLDKNVESSAFIANLLRKNKHGATLPFDNNSEPACSSLQRTKDRVGTTFDTRSSDAQPSRRAGQAAEHKLTKEQTKRTASRARRSDGDSDCGSVKNVSVGRKGKGKEKEKEKEDPTQSKLAFPTRAQEAFPMPLPRRSMRQSGQHNYLDDSGTDVEVFAPPDPPIKAGTPPSDKTALLFPYPLTGRADLHITAGDLFRVSSGDFLNDTLIEFGLRHVLKELEDNKKIHPDDVHMFNSFFYNKLSKKTRNRKVGDPEWPAYDSVKKWTKNKDVFSKKFIVVPINENMHWYFAVIYNPSGVLQRAEQTESTAGRWPATRIQTSTSEDEVQEEVEDKTFDASAKLPENAVDSHFDELDAGAEIQAAGEVGRQVEVEVEMEVDDDGDVDMEALHAGNASVASFDPLDCLDGDDGVVRHVTRATRSKDSDGIEGVERGVQRMSIEPDSPEKPIQSETWKLFNQQFDEALAPPAASPTAKKKAPPPDAQILGSEGCWIMTFDSLGSPHRAVHTVLNEWLKFEARHKRGVDYEMTNATYWDAKVPAQQNFSDCGLFLIHYTRQLLERPEETLQFIQRRPPSAYPPLTSEWSQEQERVWQFNETGSLRSFWQGVISSLKDKYAGVRAQVALPAESEGGGAPSAPSAPSQASIILLSQPGPEEGRFEGTSHEASNPPANDEDDVVEQVPGETDRLQSSAMGLPNSDGDREMDLRLSSDIPDDVEGLINPSSAVFHAEGQHQESISEEKEAVEVNGNAPDVAMYEDDRRTIPTNVVGERRRWIEGREEGRMGSGREAGWLSGGPDAHRGVEEGEEDELDEKGDGEGSALREGIGAVQSEEQDTEMLRDEREDNDGGIRAISHASTGTSGREGSGKHDSRSDLPLDDSSDALTEPPLRRRSSSHPWPDKSNTSRSSSGGSGRSRTVPLPGFRLPASNSQAQTRGREREPLPPGTTPSRRPNPFDRLGKTAPNSRTSPDIVIPAITTSAIGYPEAPAEEKGNLVVAEPLPQAEGDRANEPGVQEEEVGLESLSQESEGMRNALDSVSDKESETYGDVNVSPVPSRGDTDPDHLPINLDLFHRLPLSASIAEAAGPSRYQPREFALMALADTGNPEMGTLGPQPEIEHDEPDLKLESRSPERRKSKTNARKTSGNRPAKRLASQSSASLAVENPKRARVSETGLAGAGGRGGKKGRAGRQSPDDGVGSVFAPIFIDDSDEGR